MECIASYIGGTPRFLQKYADGWTTSFMPDGSLHVHIREKEGELPFPQQALCFWLQLDPGVSPSFETFPM